MSLVDCVADADVFDASNHISDRGQRVTGLRQKSQDARVLIMAYPRRHSFDVSTAP